MGEREGRYRREQRLSGACFNQPLFFKEVQLQLISKRSRVVFERERDKNLLMSAGSSFTLEVEDQRSRRRGLSNEKTDDCKCDTYFEQWPLPIVLMSLQFSILALPRFSGFFCSYFTSSSYSSLEVWYNCFQSSKLFIIFSLVTQNQIIYVVIKILFF